MNKIKRKFPGPAGLILNNDVPNSNSTQIQQSIQSQESSILIQNAWIRMQETYRQFTDTYNIDWIKESAKQYKQRAPFLAAAIVDIKVPQIQLPTLTLRDASGRIDAVIPQELYDKYKQHIGIGCVLVLKDFAVFTTKAHRFALIVNEHNVIAFIHDGDGDDLSIVEVNQCNVEELNESITNFLEKNNVKKAKVNETRHNHDEESTIVDEMLKDVDFSLLLDDDTDF